MFCRSRYIYFG